MRLPHVVWDMGGIMYRYFTEIVHDLGVERGWPVQGIPLGSTGDLPDPEYGRMLEGEITEATYLAIVVARLRAADIGFDPLGDIDWTQEYRPETWEAIRDIHRAGHRQVVLTNDASKWLGPRWWETWAPAPWFQAVVDVTTVGERKPAAAPYLAAAEALEADPRTCLFVDDMPVNCAGAEAVGMASLWFDITEPRASLMRLQEVLG